MDDEYINTQEEGEAVVPEESPVTGVVDTSEVVDPQDDGDRPDVDYGETAAEGDANAQQAFTERPTPPYLPGDTWQDGDTLYVCINARGSSESFLQSDWLDAVTPYSGPATTTTTVTIDEIITDYSADSLQAYQDAGAVPIAVYDDDTQVQVTWDEVYDPAATAENAANEAAEVAEAINQHFWSDDTGAHVTDEDRDSWEEEYAEDGHGELDNPSDSRPWHNILMNSLGILLRTGLRNLVSITRSAVAFFDGEGNGADNITARFGDTVRIGRSTGTHVSIEDDSIAIEYAETSSPYYKSYFSASSSGVSMSRGLSVSGDFDAGGNDAEVGLWIMRSDQSSYLHRAAIVGNGSSLPWTYMAMGVNGDMSSGQGRPEYLTDLTAYVEVEATPSEGDRVNIVGDTVIADGDSIVVRGGTVKLHDDDADADYTHDMADIVGSIPVVLFDDDSQPVSGAVTLSESAALFRRLTICFRDSDDHYGSVDVCHPDGKQVMLELLWIGSSTSTSMYMRGKMVQISGSTINTYRHTNGTYFTGQQPLAGTAWSNADVIAITQVIGYR